MRVTASNITLEEVNDLCKRRSDEEHQLRAIAGGSPLAISICEEASEDEIYTHEYAQISPSRDGAFVIVWHDPRDLKVETLIDNIVTELGFDDPDFVRFDSVHIVIYYKSRRLSNED